LPPVDALEPADAIGTGAIEIVMRWNGGNRAPSTSRAAAGIVWTVPMPANQPIKLPERPRLAAGVRLHFDQTRDAWVVLGPERIIETEGPASEILRRCDGKHTITEIVDELAAVYAADRAEIAADVTDMLAELMAKRMLSA
jgi:coenzyme PQQ biosynthesis protein PqqD